MAIRHKNLSVRRDELTLLHVTVAEWEVPLLHLVHGEGMVQERPGEPWADVDPPNVLDEYRRLENKYRTPAEESGAPGQKAVGLVYGPFGASPLLKQAIEAATFERPVDLLGLDLLKQNAAAANAAAAAANAALASAQSAAPASDETDEDESAETLPPKARQRAPKAAPKNLL